LDLPGRANEIAGRWPTVGLALGVVRDGSLACFHGHGLADIDARAPVSGQTVFRVASITKTFTAIAVMRLWEQGLVDLDAPAAEFLRAFRLAPVRSSWRPVTIRHLLTHTAGLREVLHPSGLLRMRDLGETVRYGQPVPTLAEYYGGALRVDAEPGTRFMYTNHGYAALGQIVTDVTGRPFDAYLRDHVFDPLGMDRTDLVRSERVATHRATGYELRSRGARPVADYEVVPAGAGAARSCARDLGRFIAALLGGGANEYGRVLKPDTLATMFAPHYQPDPRVAGIGLAFFRTDLGGHLAVEHDGILPGFDAQILLAPDDGVGVLALANGARRGMHWLAPEMTGLLRLILGLPEAGIRTDVPHRPELWADLCGRYGFSAGPTDPARLAFGAGAEVLVRHGRLVLRWLSPIPALYRGYLLHPDDHTDPYAFRIEFPWFGVGTCRIVFSQSVDGATTALHLDVAPMSFHKRPAAHWRRGGRSPRGHRRRT
jgi:CubicO group peptidase (beta-lactamase class C family)